MGGTTSALQTVQAKVGQMREAQEKPMSKDSASADMASIEIPPPFSSTLSDSLQLGPEDRLASADIELPQLPTETRSTDGWSRLWSWIPGTDSSR
jgi:hypothetical protein